MVILEKINEDLLKILKNEFSNIDFLDKNLVITYDIANKLFNILNRECFSSKLFSIPIYVIDAKKLYFPEKHCILYGGFFYKITNQSLIEFEKSNFKNSDVLKLEMFFKLSNLKDQNVNFYGFISIMAHEMTHMYATIIGNGKINQALKQLYVKYNIKYDDWYDPHENAYFSLQASKLEKDFGIVITKTFDDDKIQSMIENVVKNNKNFIVDNSDKINKNFIDIANKLRKIIVDDGKNAIYVDDSGITVGFFD